MKRTRRLQLIDAHTRRIRQIAFVLQNSCCVGIVWTDRFTREQAHHV